MTVFDKVVTQNIKKTKNTLKLILKIRSGVICFQVGTKDGGKDMGRSF